MNTTRKFVTSDQHFFHWKINELCNRGFNTLEEMHRSLITSWNLVVGKPDIVYCVGDFAFKNKAADQAELFKIFNELNGQKFLIVGNHDNKLVQKLPWVKVCTDLRFRHNGDRIHLYHYPIHEWDQYARGSFHFHGHVHGNIPSYGRSMDVGVDTVGASPLLLDDAIALLEHRKNVPLHQCELVEKTE